MHWSTRPITRRGLARMDRAALDRAVDLQVKGALPGSVLGCREGRNLTQAALGKLTGLHQTEISAIENGRRVPTLQNLLKISVALHCSIDSLLGVEGDR